MTTLKSNDEDYKKRDDTSSSTMASSIAAVANRIQERANQLSLERSTLELLQSQHATLQQSLENEQSKFEINRERLLIQTRAVHEHELEIMKHKRLIRDLKIRIQRNTVERKHEIQSQIENIRRQYDSRNKHVFVPHNYQTSIYHRRLKQNVQRLKAKRRRREEKLDKLSLKTERNREEIVSMEREGRRLKDEIKMMEDVEIREDEEIAAVAMQIRATLAKRKSLRTALKEAQQRNRDANDDMAKWEEECMRLSNNA